ncbi:hypothetical protein [Hyphomicrobium sp. CS1GBMeth3]|uniref:hypothetical protein n=1 Tax=Hyphomicrobium sp. CS1GBMeth3 TaxID=1892845 RepID=UPI000930B4AB|nr:hypothetical protein [Hyphomicrobium sp. CS1GBMeth3]
MSSYLLPYSAGTISLENGSKVVTGVGTAFGIAVKPGDLLQLDDGILRAIGAAEITNTGFELIDDYEGATDSGVAYKIHRVSPGWGDVANLNARVSELIEGVQRGYAMTSLSSVEIGTGEQTFIVNTALPIGSGARLNISSTVPGEEASHTMNGVVKSLVGQTLIVDVVFATGTGQTRASWNINISGLVGDVTPEAEAARDAAIEAKDDAEAAASAASASAGAASLSADAAADSQGDAESAATAAAGVQTALQSYLLTPKAADPTVDDNGNALQVGTRYYNTTTESERIYKTGGTWDNYTGADGMAALLDDTAPKLGGDLDLNGFDVPGLAKGAGSSVAGNIATFADASGEALGDSGVRILDEDDFASDSATAVPTQQSTKKYISDVLAAGDYAALKGGINCAANPDYPAANAGDTYRVTGAGRIGGAAGPLVQAGDAIQCFVDESASGNHAAVGANWLILQANVDLATDAAPGIVELATNSEAQAKTDTARAITPANLAALGATEAFSGIVELATAAETAAGTDSVRAVHPAGAAVVYTPKTRQVNPQTGTTYTFVLADAGKLCTFSNAGAITVTVPPNSSVAFPVGTQIDIAQLGAGQVTLAQGSGVTINSEVAQKKLATQYSGGTLVKTGTDTWLLVGSLAA